MSMDGLASLRAKREKAASSRHLPPARNAPKPRTANTTTPPDVSPPTNDTNPQPPPRQTGVKAAQSQGHEPSELIRATIYMSANDDDWLEDVAREARARRPRVDASRSAVARLALSRLRDSMTPEEIVDLLSNKAASSQQSVGRKRL